MKQCAVFVIILYYVILFNHNIYVKYKISFIPLGIHTVFLYNCADICFCDEFVING